MSNYTINKPVPANVLRSIEIDDRKGNLDNFTDKNWLRNNNLPAEDSKKLIEKIVIILSLVCHSSCRGIKEFMKIVFDYDISIGTISNILLAVDILENLAYLFVYTQMQKNIDFSR